MKLLLFASSIFLLIVSGCNADKSDQYNEVKEDVSSAVDQLSKEAKEAWSTTKSEGEELRNAIDEKIAKIDSQMESASEDTKQQLTKQKEQLVDWKKEVEETLQSLGSEINEGWEKVVKDTKSTYKKIRDKIA